jgi:sterol desaturase/sphingolipid hydroxylase (fatty acid hydroxylase superfamily)
LTSFAVGLAAALVNAVFIACLGETLTVATVAGANVFRVAANAAGGVLRHSPFWLSFGPTVERWAVSPAMHHIHHSADPRHWDRNFGTSLAIWDRLAGTLYIPNGKEVERFGIGAESGTFHSLAGAYLTPFRRATDALIGRKQARARSQHVESVLRCERALDS